LQIIQRWSCSITGTAIIVHNFKQYYYIASNQIPYIPVLYSVCECRYETVPFRTPRMIVHRF